MLNDVKGFGRPVGQLSLKTATGDTTLCVLSRNGRGILLDLAGGKLVAAAGPWADRVDVAIARTDQVREPGLLPRPDGHAVWVGEEAAGAVGALRTCFGGPDHG
ncbi:hypothetical protein [Kutzneria kofuensis]|uniref:Uncharacterized protein n=1 Tax=Kutzneria kofuensis TaxID=103725 RepID=A0A7W9KGK1_9PSEU|nr:hypothetical protein [Kutzneria kofuensis]MBB5892217.1 hypothetical protein [Kutzneria kofuensis]